MTPSMQEAVSAFKSVYGQGLEKRPGDVLGADEMDEMIHRARAEMGATAMKLTVEASVRQALTDNPHCECGLPLECHHRPGLQVISMQGTVDGKGISYRCRPCKRTVRPVHEQLGVQSYSKTTVLFERLSTDFFLDKGAPTAVARLKEHHGVEPGRTTVLLHAEQRGKQAQEFIQKKLCEASQAAEEARGKPPAVGTVFVQMDSSSGKTVQPLERPDVPDDAAVERTPVRKLPKVKRPVEGRQVKLLCAQAKGEADWYYDAYIGDYDDAPARLEGLAACRRWQPGVLAVMTADGDEKIREAGEGAFLPDFQFILDRPHAMIHLGHVTSHGRDAIPTDAKQWTAHATALLHQGHVGQLTREIRAIAQEVDDEKDQNKVENVATYFSARADAVHYDAFKQRGWPQASGAVEGGHIHFIHPITKRGSGWLVDNLNNTVALACIRRSGWWDQFWDSITHPGCPQAERSGAGGRPS